MGCVLAHAAFGVPLRLAGLLGEPGESLLGCRSMPRWHMSGMQEQFLKLSPVLPPPHGAAAVEGIDLGSEDNEEDAEPVTELFPCDGV
mmetsp:Transcript_20020/g.47973  ORF Transcript_20020/g.47973 Transcript_20020/m.47973 type:complete len:88 (-) Transcript_20020:196-459(-)